MYLLAYFMIGFGFGIAFYYMFYYDDSITKLERMKHDVAMRKEWFRMLSDQKLKESKWPADWS
jgi:hypothetical protein